MGHTPVWTSTNKVRKNNIGASRRPYLDGLFRDFNVDDMSGHKF